MRKKIHGYLQAAAVMMKKTVNKNGKTQNIKIDCVDLLVLRWFEDYYPFMQKTYIDGEWYAFVNHNDIIEHLPLLDINKRAYIERMQKLVEFGILKYKLLKQGGTYSLYKFGENYKYLIGEQNDIERIEGAE